MNEHNRQTNDLPKDMKRTFDIVLVIGQILCAPLHVWTRKPGTCGRRYFANACGYQAAVAPFVWVALFGGEPVPVLFAVGALYPVGAAWHWYCRRYYERRGYVVHSWYVGDPRLGRFEPAALVLTGLLGTALSPAFGTYVLAAAVGEAANSDFMKWRDRAVIGAMRDARIEARRYRDMFDQEEQRHG